MAKDLILILGGARSGKSAYAETWARQHGNRVLVVATAQAHDDEMRARIAQHRRHRPAHWRTLEAPQEVAEAIQREIGEEDTVIVDCVTLLASNILLGLPENCTQEEYGSALLNEIEALLHVYAKTEATWLVVSNEVGWGVVPPYRSGRLFRDGLGRANQRLAAMATRVIVMLAGLPWTLAPS